MCSIDQLADRTASASAPGKVILCGEHAVVYGQPAIALPVTGVSARAVVQQSGANGNRIAAPDLGEAWQIEERPDHPLAALTKRTLETLGRAGEQGLDIVVESTIPVASGMGSGAAIAAALVRALARRFGLELDAATVSTLVYESERHYHGTPSGIDNTVVSYGRPIWFQRTPDAAAPHIEPLSIAGGWTLVIGDTGMYAPTRLTVGAVRERWNRDRQGYDALFAAIGQTVSTIREQLLEGANGIGPLLDRNHRYLQAIGVSTPELDRLVLAARAAGATGAKLSGGGGGGIMLATANRGAAPEVAQALRRAGAARVIVTEVAEAGPGPVLV